LRIMAPHYVEQPKPSACGIFKSGFGVAHRQ